MTMARAYSDDLRCKILQAYERGGVTLAELAERFDVSVAYTKKIHQQQLRTGQMKRAPQSRYGPVSRVTTGAEAYLQEQVRAIPDATLAELRQALWKAQQIRLSRSQLWRVLVRMGLRMKKNRSTPPSKRPKKAASGGRHGGRI
jgi:transposase